MRLRLIALSIIFSFSFIALAEHFNVPVGKYSFSSINLYSLKHILLLDSRSSNDRKNIEELKRKNYSCKNFPNYKIQCYKFLRDSESDLEIPIDQLKALTPYFTENPIISLITEADLLSTYEVEQNVSSEIGVSSNYKLYVHETGDKRLDVKFDDKKYRYNYIDTDKLTHLLFKRKRISKKERHDLSYILEFVKEE